MGCTYCNPKIEINELDLIKDFDQFIKYLLNQIKRIQNIIKEYMKNNPYSEEDSEIKTVFIAKTEESTTNDFNSNNNEQLDIENYQYYLTLNKALLQIKIILDDYLTF
jgi:hypothetical protein